ncbi:MAG: galactose mutarotase [Oscillospiraceae bacterium]|nr:galactose mutarotase [Oscillospiraceae bacterium]
MTTVTKRDFGCLSTGEPIDLYELKNSIGAYVEIITYGGAIRSINVPDKNGYIADVALGYDDISSYENQDKYIGALIGRHGNRIEDAKFRLGRKVYTLGKNDGRNNLHGGFEGFNKKIWDAHVDGEKLVLKYTSPDGEEGYPATLHVTVKYSFDDDCALKIDYSAVSDGDTICNLTNHCYFNLDGQGTGSIENHSLKINATHFTVGNSECLPTGYVAKVEGTPLDFTDFHVIGERINQKHEQLVFAGGYDHNWCPDGEGFRHMATLKAANTGRVMEVWSDTPGMQFYSGNFLDGTAPYGKNGKPVEKRDGLCLETQFYPNAMKFDNFKKPILKAGEKYHHVTVYKFSV